MRTYPGLPDLYSRLPELDMKFGSVNVRIRNQDLEFIDIVVASSIEGRSLQFDQKIFKRIAPILRDFFYIVKNSVYVALKMSDAYMCYNLLTTQPGHDLCPINLFLKLMW